MPSGIISGITTLQMAYPNHRFFPFARTSKNKYGSPLLVASIALMEISLTCIRYRMVFHRMRILQSHPTKKVIYGGEGIMD